MGHFFSTYLSFIDPLHTVHQNKSGDLFTTSGGQKTPSAPVVPGTPGTPDPNASLEQAQVDANNRRRAAIVSGGADTNISSFGGTVPAGNLATHSLLGD